ncbi:Outer membrane protein beta-barrel domain-containing protein [Salegentibacter holothuriorum]|uniref:Outer membrane protein beta-barrel domain-containing protein n=1 Tax=Salegentibacter holothuriorum TaxID=241145 RepID=A0A1T5EQP5_9FLAO|nr:outer membrane beta-barrel protein [Salegentibacter holothuriorum]SKB86244.1 Outer membrane protein beta-barrel domain-containing protein [Salegentibacter holothuriorum]
MKKLLLPLFLAFFSLSAFSQTQNEVRLYFGITDSQLLRNDELTGGGSYEIENSYEFGFRYLLDVTENLALETGINYWRGDVLITSAPMPEQTTRSEELQTTSIPIFANYTFLDHFFVNGGPVMDFQGSESKSIDPQAGIGVGFGLGAQYAFNNFSIYINPNFRRYSVIPFEEKSNHQKLTTFGVQLGLGYKF